MTMLIDELQMLTGDWRSWIVVTLMAGIAILSVVHLFACPYVRGTKKLTDDEVETARSTPFRPGWRFGMMMVLGVALALAGLFMIANGIKPTIALALMVGGLVIVQTEPARLRIRDSKQKVVACRDAAGEVRRLAQDRLRSSHRQLAGTNVVLLGGLVGAMLAF